MAAKPDTLLAVCTGCGIGDAVKVDHLAELAAGEFAGVRCMHHPALCSEEGMEVLAAEIRKGETGKLAVAACSPRSKTENFRRDDIPVERINLREQVAWTLEPGTEETRECAEDYVRMALAKLDSVSVNEPYRPGRISREILVLGAGITGMNSALYAAGAGYRVHLVEKNPSPGGYAQHIHRWLAAKPDRFALEAPLLDDIRRQVSSHPEIRLYTGTGVASLEGEPGDFRVRLQSGEELHTGSVVVATGWEPYDASRLSRLGYGTHPGVRTLEEFEAMASGADLPDRITLVLCAGSRDPEHLPYCSSYCCTAALKQALYIRERNPEAQVYVVYRDIRTPGFQEGFYEEVQRDHGIYLTRGRVESVTAAGETLRTVVRESLLGEEVMLESDLVVLATGMVPRSTTDLHLRYRLGEGLPTLEYEFSDSHFICFPYETRRTGIFAAGTVRAPMDMAAAAADGAGAALKAVQCIESVERGESVHPRSGDRTFPELYMERCTDCKRCTEECPFGSYDENEKGTPLPHPARCRRCGICMGSCPERVIGFSDYSINSVSAMIRAVSMPDEFDEKPRILVFACENDAGPALDAAGQMRLPLSPYIRVIPVRCLGSINRVWISDALSHGYDGILQIGCKPGEDYQCHFIHGSELTEQRGENFRETLETMMLEPERIRTSFVEITGAREVSDLVNAYAEELELIGPNPFKTA